MGDLPPQLIWILVGIAAIAVLTGAFVLIEVTITIIVVAAVMIAVVGALMAAIRGR